MPCYHPLLRVLSPGQLTVNGKPDGRVVSCPPELRPPDHPTVKYYPQDLKHVYPCKDHSGLPYQIIPCGKCLGCRMQYSREWANRCMLELDYHDSAYFVTLTYNDYHVRRSFYADPSTGEAIPALTLCKRDSQLFLKRLRERYERDHIRFFMCGEYGSATWRPHMHYILFGLHLDDLTLVGQRRGNNVYRSPSLERVWSEDYYIGSLDGETCVTPLAEDNCPLKCDFRSKCSKDICPMRRIGFVEVMEVSWAACAYVARYIMKKQKGPDGTKFYQDHGLEPPFTLMSRKPGIARQWYEDHPGIDEYEYINVKTEKGGLKFTPPHYLLSLFEQDSPEESALFKANRLRMAEESVKAKLERTDLSYLEYLAVEEDKLKRRTSSLKREEI